MRPVLTRLEARDTPAVLDPTAFATPQIPGWGGPVVVAEGDFDGNGSVDRAVAAGEGGAPRVVVYSGGEMNVPPVPSPVPGVVMPPGLGEVIFDRFVFEDSFRGGADINAVHRPGEADLLVFSPGVGGGPRLRYMTLDGSVDRSFLAFDDPNYRGGLNVQATTYDPADPVGEHRFGVHLLVTAKAGGGPRASVYDADGNQLVTFLVGPADDRREYRVIASDVDVPGHPLRRGTYVESPDGRVSAFDWSGREYDLLAAG